MKFPVPILFAVISYCLYASQAYLLEQKFSHFSTPALLVILYLIMLPLVGLTLVAAKAGGEAVVWPSGGVLWWVVLAAAVFYAADAFMVMAYTSARKAGGEYLFEIVTVAALYPLFAAAIKYAFTQKLPNRWHVAAFIAVAGVLWLTAKGNSVHRAREAAKAAATPASIEPHP